MARSLFQMVEFTMTQRKKPRKCEAAHSLRLTNLRFALPKRQSLMNKNIASNKKMANCQENPTFRDKYGNDCNFYKKYPELCAESIYSANDQGQTAQMVCCACSDRKSNIPQAYVPELISNDAFEPENPCPLNQVWANSPDGRRIEVGTAVKNETLSLQSQVDSDEAELDLRSGDLSTMLRIASVGDRTTQSVASIEDRMRRLTTDVSVDVDAETKKGCWRPVAPESTAVFTCNSDDYCKNLDLGASKPGNLVYKCPQATCNIGNCYCGPECMKDDVTKICKPRNEINKVASSAIAVPPLNVCVPTDVSDGAKLCWKRTRNFDSSGNPRDSLVDCDPNFCGFSSPTTTIQLAGSQFSLYTPKAPSTPNDLRSCANRVRSVRAANRLVRAQTCDLRSRPNFVRAANRLVRAQTSFARVDTAKHIKVENFGDTAAPTSVPTTGAPTTAAPTSVPTTAAPTTSNENIEPSTIVIIIILVIIGIILLGVLIQFLITNFSNTAPARRNRFG